MSEIEFNSNYIKNGLYAGLACVLIYFVSHTFDPGFYIKQSKLFGGLILILFLIKSCKDELIALGGFASFGELLKASFITYLIAAFIISIFTYILYNFINPNLARIELDITMEIMEKALDWVGAPDDVLEEVETELDKVDYQKDFFTVLTDFISKLFSGIILSLIISAVYKKNRTA